MQLIVIYIIFSSFLQRICCYKNIYTRNRIYSLHDIQQSDNLNNLKNDLLEKLNIKIKNDRSIQLTIKQIENEAIHINTSYLYGKWLLVYTDDDITRSSPFFWAFRKACKDIAVIDPLRILGTDSFPEAVFKITDSIPFKSIGKAVQTITENQLISQVELSISNLPLQGKSLMTTTSFWKCLNSNKSNMLELTIEKTQVKESTISKLLPFIDFDLAFPSGAALEAIKVDSSKVIMQNIYIDSELRISKNILDDKYFVFKRDF